MAILPRAVAQPEHSTITHGICKATGAQVPPKTTLRLPKNLFGGKKKIHQAIQMHSLGYEHYILVRPLKSHQAAFTLGLNRTFIHPEVVSPPPD